MEHIVLAEILIKDRFVCYLDRRFFFFFFFFWQVALPNRELNDVTVKSFIHRDYGLTPFHAQAHSIDSSYGDAS